MAVCHDCCGLQVPSSNVAGKTALCRTKKKIFPQDFETLPESYVFFSMYCLKPGNNGNPQQIGDLMKIQIVKCNSGPSTRQLQR